MSESRGEAVNSLGGDRCAAFWIAPLAVTLLLLVSCVGSHGSIPSEATFASSTFTKHPFQLEVSGGQFRYFQFGIPEFHLLTGGYEILEQDRRRVVLRAEITDPAPGMAETVFFRVLRDLDRFDPQLAISSDGATFHENGWEWLAEEQLSGE